MSRSRVFAHPVVLGMVVVLLGAAGAVVWVMGHTAMSSGQGGSVSPAGPPGSDAQFARLAAQQSNYCSLDQGTVNGYPDDHQMQGACCDAMDMDKYRYQVTGLRQFAAIPEIPTDPYDVEAGQAKQLLRYTHTIKLSGTDKATYDAAMQMTEDQGPCCCQCWRWYMTEGLDKFLISRHHLSAQQVAQITDLVNGCGGPLGSTPSPSDRSGAS